jgi:catechol 2,3-dioxygenase-like lactoylglutathione lyase family enzyme
MKTSIHHVSLATTDLERSTEFYHNVLGLNQLQRPPLRSKGVWFECGPLTLHLIANPAGTFRNSAKIDPRDMHFAVRVDDFEEAMRELAAKGYRADAADGDPMRIAVDRGSLAGFPQAYLLDPDRNVVEINGAA